VTAVVPRDTAVGTPHFIIYFHSLLWSGLKCLKFLCEQASLAVLCVLVLEDSTKLAPGTVMCMSLLTFHSTFVDWPYGSKV